MTVWMVRAGKHGEWEDWSLEQGRVAIDFGVRSLASANSKEDVVSQVRKDGPGLSDKKIISDTSQLWRFKGSIDVGDLVVLPLKRRSAIAVGEVDGPYEHQADSPVGALHTRRVKWLRTDIPRSSVDQDLRYSLTSLLTVCTIKRPNGEERLRALADGRYLPLPSTTDGTDELADDGPVDIAQAADDAVREHIGRKFQGHELERLIDAILKAQGYETSRSTVKGPDGGVDVLAGRGPMGFDSPHLAVQVKSGTTTVGEPVLNELLGVIGKFGGDQGLLVSWGGFTAPARDAARRAFFKVRLWDDGDVVEALLDNYERLAPDIQAEIPLKRIWTLVQPDVSEG